MSQTILLKVHNATKTVAEHTVVTKDGQPTVIKAQSRVNYELLNPARGTAPDHIITKRVGKDLHISLEKEGEESDIIIEGYYDNPNSAIIGIAEDGQYYYYIPDTGEVVDYVTELALGDIEGQALGGQPYVAPWWMGATTEGGILPWLVGLAAVAGIAALAKGSDDDKDTTAPEAPTVTDVVDNGDNTDTIKGTAEPGSTVKVTDPEGKVIGETTADKDGNYEVKVPALEEGKEYDVTATDKDGNESDPEVIDLKAPEAPKVTDLTAEVDGNTVKGTTEPGATVKVKDKDGNVIGEATADENGNYEVPVKPALTNGEKYDVTATDKDGNESEPKEITGGQTDFTAPEAPTVTDVTTDDKGTTVTGKTEPNATVEVKDKDGNVVGTAKADDQGNYTVTTDKPLADGEYDVVAKDEAGNDSEPATATVDTTAPEAPKVTDLTAEVDGNTVKGTTEPGATVKVKDKDGNVIGEATADENGNYEVPVKPALTNGEKYDVTATDKDGNESEPKEITGGQTDFTAPEAPTVTDVVDNGDNTDTIKGTAEPGSTVKVTDPEGKVIGETTADKDGNYEVKVPALEEGKEYDVTATDKDGNESDPEVIDLKAPEAPTVTDVKTGENGTTVTGTAEPNATVEVKDKDGNVVGTAKADDKGNYTVTTDKPLADGEYDVVAKDEAGNPSEPATATVDTTPPAKPVLTAKEDGTVDVKVPADEDAKSVTVNVTDPVTGTSTPVTLTKESDGSWTSSNPDVVPSIPKGSDTATIPADKVKDGSQVTATATDGKNTSTAEPVEAKVGGDTPATTEDTTPPAKPVLTAKEDGTVDVKVPADEDAKSVTVNVTDPVTGTSTPVTLTKESDGSWTSSNPDVVPSIPKGSDTATIPADKVKDGSQVTATATDGKNTSTAEPVEAKVGGDTPATTEDTTPPAKPVLTAKEDGTVDVKVPADEDAKSVTVNVTDPVTGTSTPVTLTKESDGSWTSSNPDVVPSIPKGSDTATIPADKVKDGSQVTATATDGKNTSTAEPVEAKVGGDTPATTEDTTPPAKPVLTAKEDGTVDVKVPADEDAKSVTVNVTDPVTGTSTPVTLTKESDGSWTSSNPDVVPSIPKGSDTATIPADKVKDGSQVTATATDGKNTSTAEPVEAKVGGDTPATTEDTTPPAKPVLTAKEDGTVDVKVPADEDAKSVTVNVTDPVTGTSTPVTLTKESDGSWTSSNPDVVPSIPKGSDTATIPADKVKDGSQVTATATDGKNTSTAEPVEAKVGGDTPATTEDTTPPAKPVLTAKEDGTVDVKVPADEDAKSVTVNVTDPVTGTSTPVTLTKESDGSWTSSNPDVVPSIPKGSDTATIPADKVKDGSQVTATATDGKNTSTAEPVEAKVGGDTTTPPVLDLQYAEDTVGAGTSGTATDNISNKPTVNVTGIPAGAAWEYSLDGGKTWTDGTGTSFVLPEPMNGKEQTFPVATRVKGQADTKVTEDFTYDKVARLDNVTFDKKNTSIMIEGKAEPGSKVTITGFPYDVLVLADGTFSVELPNVDATNQQQNIEINVIDVAGNTASKTFEVSQYRNLYRPQFDTIQPTLDDNANVVIIGEKGALGDIGAANIAINNRWEGTLMFGDGEDALIGAGAIAYSRTQIDMGQGDDTVRIKAYVSDGAKVFMGDGDDFVKLGDTTLGNGNAPWAPGGRSIASGAVVDLGAGDDRIEMTGTVGGTDTRLVGGSGFDTLTYYGEGTRQNGDGIFGMERIDLTTGDNRLDLRPEHIRANVDTPKAGTSYLALIIDGNAGDTVDLGDNGGTATSPNLGDFQQVTNRLPNGDLIPDGYNAYIAGYDLDTLVLIQQGITVL